VAQLGVVEDLKGTRVNRAFLITYRSRLAEQRPETLSGLIQWRQHQVFQHAQARHLTGQLEAAHQALGGQTVGGGPGNVLAEEEDLSGLGAEHAGDDIEAGGLAGAVRADQAGDMPARQPAGQAVEGLDAPKGFLEAAGLEDDFRPTIRRL
jgi:hypothetical protein